jgi:predicted RNA binding protein YcfA (HicA-like mRNA interferase family)
VPLKPLPFNEVCRRLKAAGFNEVSQKGSHVKFSKVSPDGTRIAIVPKHTEVKVGTLRSILRQTVITPEEWEKL